MKLYHGTSGRFLPSIMKDGLKPRGVGKRGTPSRATHAAFTSPTLGESYRAKTRRLFGDLVEEQPAHTFNDPRIPVKDMRILNLRDGRVVSEKTFSLPDERDTRIMMALLDEARKETAGS